MKSISRKAYGKINLFLSVGKKRTDGKHEVQTVLCRVGVYDTVTVSETEGGGIELLCSEPSLPTDEKNIAYMAAKRYFEACGCEHSVKIEIEKRIPVVAGMGGGSSDAAAVLLSLNELYGALTFERLDEIAASLGSDVPFFLYEKDVMLGVGTGDKMSPCPPFPFTLYGAFVRRFEKLSTGRAYALLDEIKGEKMHTESPEGLIKALNEKDLSAFTGELANDFEALYEDFDAVKAELLDSGATAVLLSGSGPTVCGIFTDEKTAKNATKDGFCAKISVGN